MFSKSQEIVLSVVFMITFLFGTVTGAVMLLFGKTIPNLITTLAITNGIEVIYLFVVGMVHGWKEATMKK